MRSHARVLSGLFAFLSQTEKKKCSMARGKHLKSDSNNPKRKKLGFAKEVCAEEMLETEIKKKRKKPETEETPVQIPDVTVTTDGKTRKRDKKLKKEKVTAPAEQSEISDLSSRPEELVRDEELSPEEKRVLERKMKKILKKEEKKRLKAAGETQEKTAASGPSAPQQALDYLTCWAENRTEWKFQKTRQTWLLQHMFDCEKIPDETFCVLLQYIEGLCGAARDTTVQKALALVEESGQAPDDAVVQQRAHRAREVIQLLS